LGLGLHRAGSEIFFFVSRPLQESLETQSSLRKECIIVAPKRINNKFSPRAGSMLFISIGSVDMNIIPFFLLLFSLCGISVSRPASGRA
jgi:hypothetical protein